MNTFDLHSYDHYIVSFSGGKDSTACFLYLLEQGVPKEKIELWHQEIDGKGETFFDWEITPDYCRKFAVAFGVPIYFQWKEGGFKREMLRENSLTAPTCFELPNGCINKVGGERGKLSTRLKFPQASADLKVRWCSAYLKINVYSTSIINQERFRNKRTIILSGERGEESPQRAKYKIFEPDRTDLRNGKIYTRHVDRFRPVRDWKEGQVWQIIEKYHVRVHPCYYLGWGRCSCKFCIFGNKNQFASAAKISPEQTQYIVELEKLFKCTIKRNMDLQTLIDSGSPYDNTINGFLTALATQHIYNVPIIIPDDDVWLLPAGAFGEACGST
jgi:3'-phosphoadenosine 5'-phosphosulfate sulfotransferase (PAPS reductase)/FAD synthetase